MIVYHPELPQTYEICAENARDVNATLSELVRDHEGDPMLNDDERRYLELARECAKLAAKQAHVYIAMSAVGQRILDDRDGQ